jgi:septum site-determining protein MinC
MSKITIVSRGDQALLIDISGCSTFKEAIEQLSSTFLAANQFWQEQSVDLNLGSLLLNRPQAAQIIALANGVGATPKQVFARNIETISALEALQISVTRGQPTVVSSVTIMPKESKPLETPSVSNASDEQGQEQSLPSECKELMTTDVVANAAINTPTNADKAKIEQVILFDAEEQTKQSAPAEGIEGEASYELSDSLHATELETREDIVIAQNESTTTVNSGKPVTLYLKQTLRAGQAVSHKGDLILIGDVNAGAEVFAEGDITIWGSLRGIAHAGVAGNTKAEIRALRLQPIQIRIANYIARSPDGQNPISAASQSPQYAAEIAKLVNGKIRILRNTFEG